ARRNNGWGGSPPADGPPLPVGVSPGGAVMGAFDEDRVLDLATANFGSNPTSILINPTILPPPPPPAGTTAVMILRGSNTVAAVAGPYEIYDVGNNAILAAYELAQIGTDWRCPRPGPTGRHHHKPLRHAHTAAPAPARVPRH